MAGNPKLIDKLSSQLTSGARHLFEAIVLSAREMGAPAFLVGGPVRDLLLDRPVLDIDIAVEGDAIALAQQVTSECEGAVVKRSEFGTARLRLDRAAIDLVTARSETYPKPGALPKVEPATIEEDLRRRDFTINAIALELGTRKKRLIDPVGGVKDAHARLIRLLHNQSFRDDPTRILRAVRYETRLGFTIEPVTMEILRHDVCYLNEVSGTRIRRELARSFQEDDPARTLARMQELGVLAAIHPAVRLDGRQLQSLDAIGALQSRMHAVVYSVLAWHIPDEQLPEFASRLALTNVQREAVLAVPAVRSLRSKLVRDIVPSEVDSLLRPHPWPTVWALGMAEDTAAGAWARDYVGEMMYMDTELHGDDLLAMGIPRGPKIGEVLSVIRKARLDGVVQTREEEEMAVRHLIAAASENGHND